MRHYCTYFDSNYLLKGFALYKSLRQHSEEPFTLWILCFDDSTYRILGQMALPDMKLISQEEFEDGDEELFKAKNNRSRVEYYWTCTPSLPLYVFRRQSEIDLITYLDADLYFYSDPQPIYDELGDSSILIIEHRYAPEYAYMATTSGIYNVGVMAFRDDEHGLACLCWWRERCLEWCYNRAEDGKFGDQKYMDDWLERFKEVVVLQHKGAGLAPWNVQSYRVRKNRGIITVDDQPLVFYHFHSLKLEISSTCQLAHPVYKFQPGALVTIYLPYLYALKGASKQIDAVKADNNQAAQQSIHPYVLFRVAFRNLSVVSVLLETWLGNKRVNKLRAWKRRYFL